jgi:hypothetical protein
MTLLRLLVSYHGGFAVTFRYARDKYGNHIAAPESVGCYAEERAVSIHATSSMEEMAVADATAIFFG